MLKASIWSLLFMLVVFNAGAQGWRKGEMEVRVSAEQVSEVQKILYLGFPFEPASKDGSAVRMYLIPDELNQLKHSALRYEITIADMNNHFKHFWDNPLVPSGYYTYDEIIAIADSLSSTFPTICKKELWGTSLGGRQLAALKISDNAGSDEPEPEIMFDGGIHGDEVGGSQNVIMFARDLCLRYGTDPTITDLVNTREIWLYLMVNPDGRVSMSRYNNNGVDCNRDNGYMWNAEGNSSGAFSQVETKALRNGILNNQFVVYTNYHSGTEILSYPWSYRPEAPRDYPHINHLANVYSSTSGYTGLLYGQGYNIMYAINGSTKDYQFGSLGNIGWSMEISMSKQPPASQINYYYNANRPAMLEMIKECGWGVTGIITDSVTGTPVRASVWVNNLYPVYTDPLVGDYHKYLIPGTYTIKVLANGYQTKVISNITVPSQGSAVADIQLTPLSNHFAYKVMICRIPGNNFSDEGYTPGALGSPDGVPYSLGKNGWIVLDMGDTIFNGQGADFKVIQAGTVNKSYTVSGGNNMDGPFINIGVGNGTTSFDLNVAFLNKVRYLHIKDNGAGPASGIGAGFNLDAVEVLTLPVTADFTSTTNIPCSGTHVDFTDNSTGNPTSWEWLFPGGTPSSSNDRNPGNIRYDVPGYYDVTLTVSNQVFSDSKTKPGFIHVQPLPVVTLGNDTVLCEWNTLLLDAGNPGGTYLWSTGETTRSIIADSSGIGYGSRDYWVYLTDSSGCHTSDTIYVTFDNCTALHEVAGSQDVSVTPNPANTFFIISIQGFNDGNWQLMTGTGMVIRHAHVPGPGYTTRVETGEMARGVYILKVQQGQRYLIKKVIISSGHGN